jgi:hypothetical protein
VKNWKEYTKMTTTTNNSISHFASDTEDEREFIQPVPKEKVKRAPRSIAKAELYDGEDLDEFDDLKFLGEVNGLTTEMLFEKFGAPMDNPDTSDETMDWRYEYRIRVGKKLYCVYDKLNWDDTWDSDDCIEWYANGEGSMKTLVAGLGI